MAVLPRGTRVLKMVALVCSEGEGFGPLISKGHPSDTQAGPVEGSVVSVDLNWMRGDSEFLKHNLSTHTKVPMLEILFAGGGEGSLFFLINYFWLCWVFAAHGLSPVVVSGGYSLVVVKCWLLIDMSSLVEKHRL